MADIQGKISIRGLDPEMFAEARAAAIKKRQTIGEFMNEAIKEKLRRGRKVK